MNEIGLDPGIDHLYAVKTIEEVHRDGGKVKKKRLSFVKWPTIKRESFFSFYVAQGIYFFLRWSSCTRGF